MFGFGTSLLALAYAALSMGSVPLAAAGPTAGIERPYTNAEAIRRGLPLLKPRQPCERSPDPPRFRTATALTKGPAGDDCSRVQCSPLLVGEEARCQSFGAHWN